MSLDQLKERVWLANLDLVKHGLVTLTWGNASGFDRDRGRVVIKPSGMAYSAMRPEDMVVIDLEGRKVEGKLNPSSDTPTHLELYRAFKGLGGLVHTHSRYATMFAQAYRPIPCLGTTHADHFNGEVPVTRMISREEVEEAYEKHTGTVIVERFSGLRPLEIPGVLVAGHGAFTWGRSPEDAVLNGIALEAVAERAWGALSLNSDIPPFPGYLLGKHYLRKHGPDAYYGQDKDHKA